MIRRWIEEWIDAIARNEDWAKIILYAGMLALLVLALLAAPDRETANAMRIR